ncbi:zinc-dependent hydrolase, putative [Geobacter metallireducens GS-15]|uniref:Zinc-dependent hydrolase, putative n=2 Tax=Geobacter metallireducens TaxID=28232 RepID=Q39TJ7_GEOMG|nr:zinc-dependent hydrolase, putative [Geobacter metallireducens GS-15]
MLINGGISCIVPDILEQFRAFRIDDTKIDKLLILHSHFDHVGIVPFFLRRKPGMVLYGSCRSLEVLQKPKALHAINAASRYVIESSGLSESTASCDLEWREGYPGIAVANGDMIDLGGLEVQIFDTPGHSPCSVSAYVPRLEALFPSDAGGVPSGEKIVTYGTSNYGIFEESLCRLKELPIAYYCADHCGYVTGDEAAGFVTASLAAATARRNLMISVYRRTGNLDDAARELAEYCADENIGGIVPPETFVEAQRQILMHLVGLK